jgi:hypothetical protein
LDAKSRQTGGVSEILLVCTLVVKNVARELLVLKHAMKPECRVSRSFLGMDHCSRTADAQLLVFHFGRRQQDLDANLAPDRRTLAAQNQRSIERNIARESPRRMFDAVVPMEDDGEPELISNGGSPLHLIRPWILRDHTQLQGTMAAGTGQETNGLKI